MTTPSDLPRLYRQHYRRLGTACLAMSLGGFTVDGRRREQIARECAAELLRLRGEIRRLTPFDLFGKGKRKGEEGKGLSNGKVAAYFYEHLKCRVYVNRKTKNPTCDEEAIRRLMRAYKKARPVGNLILTFRMWQKRAEFVAAERVDDDGKFRAEYTPTAVSGRLQSRTNALGTGSNNQNPPRPPSPVRSIFVPDRGHVLIECDFSRIEDRLLGGMSGDPRMMQEAQPEWEGDSYQDVADALNLAAAFDELYGPVTAEDDPTELLRPSIRKYYVRQTGKRIKLAAGYGMQGETMSKSALLETEGALALDPKQCDAWLAQLHKLRKGIPLYQAWVREDILHRGYLENSWGRRYYFRKLRITEGDLRDGYAWRCQSENGTNCNQLGFLPAVKAIKENKWDARVVQQGHDALVETVHPAHAYDLLRFTAEAMGQPRTYPGRRGPWTLACPVGYKLGASWGVMTEWKRIPSRSEFDAALDRVLAAVWWRPAVKRRA